MVVARVHSTLTQSKYLVLLAAFVILPTFQSISDGDPEHELAFWMTFVAVLWVGVTLVANARAARLTAALLAVLAAVGVFSVPFLGLDPTGSKLFWVCFRHGTGLGLLLLLAVSLLRDILKSLQIRFDHICGGLCAFLMIGYAWAMLYSLIERLNPGAFRIDRTAFGIVGAEVAYRQLSVLTYYSFIVLTTTGFGDVTPLGPLARAATVTEAITGQFFLAVLIARLVSQNLTRPQESVDRPPATNEQHPRKTRADNPHPRPRTPAHPAPIDTPTRT